MTDRPLKILFAADVRPDHHSGAAGTELQTIQAMRRMGHEVDEIWAGNMPRRIKHGNLHYLLELPSGYEEVIDRYARRKQYDVYHVNQGHCYRAAKKHQRTNRPGVFICRSHGLDDHCERVLKEWRNRLGIQNRRRLMSLPGCVLDALLHRHDTLAYKFASGVIVSSSLDADYLVNDRRMPTERVGLIPQAPAETFTEPAPRPMDPQRLKRILHVGGFAYWKGIHAVAEAITRILSAYPDASMTWVCRPEDHSRARELLSPDALARVQMLGWAEQAQLRDIYDEHGILLCPSLFEGFNKVFLEAMARGLCVIATPTGGMRDVIESGKNGTLVKFHDPQGIAEAIVALWSHPAEAVKMSASAAEEAGKYSWTRVAKETVAFYRRLLTFSSSRG